MEHLNYTQRCYRKSETSGGTLRKKMVSFSHSDVLTQHFFSFVKCEFIGSFIMMPFLRPILQSAHWIEWLEQEHLSFGGSVWQYLLHALHTKEWRMSLFIKNGVWMLLPAGEVHSKDRSQARRGVCTRVVVREMLHPSSEEGRGVPDIGGGMQELSLGLAAVASLKEQRKMLLPISQSLQTQREVRHSSCALFASHLPGTQQKRSCVSPWWENVSWALCEKTEGMDLIQNQLQQSVL